MGDFNRDGIVDMALSEPIEDFGRNGGMFEIYLQNGKGAWRLIGDALLHPKAISLESIPAKPKSTRLWTYMRGGANYGGLAGADAYCQARAQAAGRGNVKWVAYLSTQGPGAVNARERIGQGPWYNARGAMVAANLGELHGDTLDQARMGNRINKNNARDEKGEAIKGVGDMPNQHDILTGSQPDGRAFTDGMDHTCNNYTSGADGRGAVQLGHHDKIGNANGSSAAAVLAHGSPAAARNGAAALRAPSAPHWPHCDSCLWRNR